MQRLSVECIDDERKSPARALQMVAMKKRIEVRSGLLTFSSSLRGLLDRYEVVYRAFKGGVIDLETNEKAFLDELRGADRYENHSAVCVGILDKSKVEIIAKTWDASDELFIQIIDDKVKRTSHPFYAYNVGCDMALLSKLLGREIRFERELKIDYRGKRKVVRNLGIPNFDDPFNGAGILAAREWTRHLETHEIDCVERIFAHNLACVLKEYCILAHRGYKEIKSSSCKEFFEGRSDLVFKGLPKKTLED